MGKINFEKSNFKIFIDNIRVCREYFFDAIFYIKNSMYSKNSSNNYDYMLLMKSHALEKGMAIKDKRPFGQKKVLTLLKIMEKAKEKGEIKSGYKIAQATIIEWLNIFEQNKWTDDEIYKKVKREFADLNFETSIKCGSKRIFKKEIEKEINGKFEDFCKSRHSIRTFSSKKIKEDDLLKCIEIAKNTPSACNRQMCKVYMIESAPKKEILINTNLGLSGFDKNNMTLFVITYDMNAFHFFAERNQGEFNSGLFAMNFVYGLHYNGIGSCFLQWNEKLKIEKKIKKELDIPLNEKISVVIGAGYYNEEALVPISNKRDKNEILYKR